MVGAQHTGNASIQLSNFTSGETHGAVQVAGPTVDAVAPNGSYNYVSATSEDWISWLPGDSGSGNGRGTMLCTVAGLAWVINKFPIGFEWAYTFVTDANGKETDGACSYDSSMFCKVYGVDNVKSTAYNALPCDLQPTKMEQPLDIARISSLTPTRPGEIPGAMVDAFMWRYPNNSGVKWNVPITFNGTTWLIVTANCCGVPTVPQGLIDRFALGIAQAGKWEYNPNSNGGYPCTNYDGINNSNVRIFGMPNEGDTIRNGFWAPLEPPPVTKEKP
jgi:hypothetical protein